MFENRKLGIVIMAVSIFFSILALATSSVNIDALYEYHNDSNSSVPEVFSRFAECRGDEGIADKLGKCLHVFYATSEGTGVYKNYNFIFNVPLKYVLLALFFVFIVGLLFKLDVLEVKQKIKS